MGGGLANEVFSVGAVEVDVASVGVRVLLVDSFQPEDTSEDGVVFSGAIPDRARESAFEGGVDGSAFTDFLTHDEVANWGLVRSFGEAYSISSGRDRCLEG